MPAACEGSRTELSAWSWPAISRSWDCRGFNRRHHHGHLVGSALLTLAVGLALPGFSRRRLLLGASALMAATGMGFSGLTSFWPLLVVAIVGTLNPTAGDEASSCPWNSLFSLAASPPRTGR